MSRESEWVIGAVERDTGIGRDTLCIWERRYGFPIPERNAKGERVYSAEQIGRLQVIRRSGKATLNLGVDVPMDQVVEAVCRSPVRAEAPSFSRSYPRGSIRAQYEELADRLPPAVTVWVGCLAASRLSRLSPSVKK